MQAITNFSIIICNFSYFKMASLLYIHVTVTCLVAWHPKLLPIFGKGLPCYFLNSQILSVSLSMDMCSRLYPTRQSCLELEYKEVRRAEDSSGARGEAAWPVAPVSVIGSSYGLHLRLLLGVLLTKASTAMLPNRISFPGLP